MGVCYMILLVIVLVGRCCCEESSTLSVSFATKTRSFENCTECLYAEAGNFLEIACRVSGGAGGELSIKITIGQTDLQAERWSDDLFVARLNGVTEEYHFHEVKCQVQELTPHTRQPLYVKALLYVILRLGTPVLTVTSLTEGQPGNITCRTRSNRPRPHMEIIVGGEKVSVDQAEEHLYGVFSRITSVATIQSSDVERSWNNKKIMCCLTHIILPWSRCSNAHIVEYIFSPEDVTISLIDISSELQPPYIMEVVCEVVNANPPCDATSDIDPGVIVNRRTYRKQSVRGGTTTSLYIIISVTEAFDGQLLTCYAKCSNFSVDASASLKADITRQPKTNETRFPILPVVVPAVCVPLIIALMVPLIIYCRRRCKSSTTTTTTVGTVQGRDTYLTPSDNLQTSERRGMYLTASSSVHTPEERDMYVAASSSLRTPEESDTYLAANTNPQSPEDEYHELVL